MGKKVYFFIVVLCCMALSVIAAEKKFTLVIDAGHGGKDAGALGSFSKEKNVALSVALAFGRYVENNCPDVKVIYTRKTDVFIPLHERASIANRNKADLFVSIHCNALPKGKISRGMETYTLGLHRAEDNLEVAKRENAVILVESDYKQRYAGFDPRSSESYIMFEFIQDKNMEKSVDLARLVQQKVCGGLGRPNKGVKQAGFLVLRETSMPSCLIELGFITTPDEERLLNDKSKIDALGRSIYEAFVAYKKKVIPGTVARQQHPAADNSPEVQSQAPQQRPQVPQQRPAVSSPQESQPQVAQQNPASQAKEQADSLPSVVERVEPSPVDTLSSQPVIAQDSAPVFMVQVAASPQPMSLKDRYFKGRTDIEHFEESNMHKYAIGASTDYYEVQRLCNRLQSEYNTPFVVAFKDGKKIDKEQAIREFRVNRSKQK